MIDFPTLSIIIMFSLALFFGISSIFERKYKRKEKGEKTSYSVGSNSHSDKKDEMD